MRAINPKDWGSSWQVIENRLQCLHYGLTEASQNYFTALHFSDSASFLLQQRIKQNTIRSRRNVGCCYQNLLLTFSQTVTHHCVAICRNHIAGRNSDDQWESFCCFLAAAAASTTTSRRKDLVEIKTVHPPGGEREKSDSGAEGERSGSYQQRGRLISWGLYLLIRFFFKKTTFSCVKS